ncbi:MAG: hypothetical protein KGS45_02830 [Planctomycetes bacterium]|nr:hypothetical protein [Planctomycetota bacterium]
MFFRRLDDAWDAMTAGERARLLHSRWLTEALRSGRDLPRIPLRRVEEGGWEELLAKPKGRDVAERWWRRALRWVDWE